MATVLTAFNAASQELTALSVSGMDVTQGHGISPMSFGASLQLFGVSVPNFPFGVSVAASFADGRSWLQTLNALTTTPAQLYLFCFANGFVLAQPNGTVELMYSQQ